MRNIVAIQALCVSLVFSTADVVSAEFVLPFNPGEKFVIGPTAYLVQVRAAFAAASGYMYLSEPCDSSAWVVAADCAWEVQGGVDCMRTNALAFAGQCNASGQVPPPEAFIEQAQLPQACLDRLALQYCGYNPPVDWPVTCANDGWCCVD